MTCKIKKFVDAYGKELWEYFFTKKGHEIVERDDGFINVSQIAPKNYFLNYKKWSLIQKKAIKYAKGRVLDIGCGAGKHSLYLQKKGLKVTGIDNSPLAIKVCKLRGLKIAKILSIDEVDKFKLSSFDTILMLGNNFGLFGSFVKAKKFLKIFFKITSKNALIIVETTNPYQTKNPDHLSYHKLNLKKRKMAGQLRLRVRHKKLIGEWFDYLMVSKKELKKILENTGWRIKKIIDSKSGLYIAVIEKI